MTDPRDRLDEWQELADGISPDMATSFHTNGDFDITLYADPDDEESERAFTNLHFLRAAPIAVPALVAAVRAVLDLHDPREGEWSCGNPVHTNPDIGCPDCGLACRTCGESVPCPEWLAVTDALGGGS